MQRCIFFLRDGCMENLTKTTPREIEAASLNAHHQRDIYYSSIRYMSSSVQGNGPTRREDSKMYIRRVPLENFYNNLLVLRIF